MKNFCFAALAVFGLVAMHSGAAHAQAMVSMDIKLNTSSPIYIGNLMGLTVESTSGYTAGPPVSYYNSPGAITWSSQTTSICTVPATGNNDFSVNNNKAPATQTITVTTIKPGTCVIKVDQAAKLISGVGQWAAGSATRSFDVLAKPNTTTILFPQPADAKFTDFIVLQASLQFNNIATDAAVTFNATGDPTPAVCTTTAAGVVTPKGVGTCTIRAYYGGGDPFYPGVAANSPATRSFQITQAKDAITLSTPASAALDAGSIILVAATTSGTAVTYSASGACSYVTNTDYTKSPPVVSAVVQPNGVGTCTVTATSSASANFTVADSVSRSIQITGQANKITFPQAAATPFSSAPPPLQATAASGAAVTYALAGTTTTTTASTGTGTTSTTSTTTTTSNVCTVTPSGAVTFVAPGLCSISASQGAQGNYAAATPVTMSFNVLPNANAISFAKPADQPYASGTVTVTATASSGQPVTYTSNSAGVCTIAPTGVITFVATGACSITAAQAAVSAAPSTYFVAAAPITQVFQIVPSGNAITFARPVDTKLTATPPVLAATLPANAPAGLSIGYAGQTPAVCTVTPQGALTLKAAGYCGITATQVGASPVGLAVAAPASVSFQVLRGDNVITFNPAAPSSVALASGSLTLVATSTASLSGPSASPVAFVSTTTTICTVSPVGVVTLLTRGTCLIAASHAGDTNYVAATSVQLRISVTSGVSVVTFAPLPSTAYGSPAPLLTASSSLGYNVSYASTTASTCTVAKMAANWVISFAALGTCSITASDGTAQASQSFQVTAGINAITFPQPANVALTSPAPLLTATATSGQPVSYAATTLGTCTVTPTGTIKLAAGGTCAITASQAAVGTFAAATSVTRTFTVTTGTNTITFPALADTVFTSPPPVLAATASSGLPVSYASTSPSICTITATRITFIAGGTCSISASQAGSGANAAAAPVTQSFKVLPAANVIAFAQPGDAALPRSVPTLTATASSGLPVGYTSATTSICTAAPSGTIMLLAPGACTITAAQSGNASFVAAAPVTQTFTVRAGGNVITFPQPAPTPLTSPSPVLAATASSGLAVAYTSGTQSVCKVTPAGVISFVTSGTCSITAAQAGQGSIAAALPVTRAFLVQQVANTAVAKASPVAASTLAKSALGSTATGVTAAAAVSAATSSLADTISSGGEGPTPDEQLIAKTSALGKFVARRNELIASNGPDGSREIDRLVEAGGSLNGAGVSRLTARSGLATASRLDGPDTSDRIGPRNGGLDRPLAALFGGNVNFLGAGNTDQGGTGGGSVQIGGLRINGAADGGMRFGFATSLHDVTKYSADSDARKAADAGFALTANSSSMSAARPNPFDLWVEGKFTSFGDPSLSSNQDGTLAIGSDYVVSPAMLLGSSVQFDSVSQRSNGQLAGASATKGGGWMAGPYTTLRLSPDIFWQVRAAWGQSSGTVSALQTSSSGFDSTTWLASTTLSGRWTAGAWSFRPSASVAYLEDVSKSSADANGVAAASVKSSLGQAKVGPEVGYRFELGRDTVIEPHAGLQVIWNFAQQTTAGGVAIGTDTLGSNGVRGRVELGVRASTVGGIGLDLSGSYDGVGAADYGTITGRAELRVPLN